MGSGILLAVLVVLWIVVLVPMVLHRGQSGETATNEGTGSTMRILHRRGSESKASLAGEAIARLQRPLRDPRVEADVVMRRRRTLSGLIALAVLWAGLALFYRSYFWTAQIVLDLMVFGYLVYLRLEAQREAERRDRRAARFSERPTGSRQPAGPRAPSGRRLVRQEPTFSDAEVTGPIPPVTREQVPTGWTPNPVPVPTYVTKATAPKRRHVLDDQVVGIDDDRLVGIDDDDPNFIELSEWQGQRAVGD